MNINKACFNFWYTEQGEILKGCSNAELLELEKKYSLKLPEKYKLIMLISNGGIADFEIFKDERWISLTPFYELSKLHVTKIIDENNENIINRLLVIGDDGTSLYGLNYDNEEPSVIYADCYGDFEIIANNFNEFINLLSKREYIIPDENAIIALQDEDQLSKLVERVGKYWKNSYGQSLPQIAAAIGADKSLKLFIQLGLDLEGVMDFAKKNNRDHIIKMMNEIE